jgi:hypothetical protein
MEYEERMKSKSMKEKSMERKKRIESHQKSAF